MKVRIKTIHQTYEPWWYETEKGKVFDVKIQPARECISRGTDIYVVSKGHYKGYHICKNHAIVEQSIDIPERLFKI
jgi:hypothetical protein